MTGFLHRLAQRANGTARLVRATTATRLDLGLSLQGDLPPPMAPDRSDEAFTPLHGTQRPAGADEGTARPIRDTREADAATLQPAPPSPSSPSANALHARHTLAQLVRSDSDTMAPTPLANPGSTHAGESRPPPVQPTSSDSRLAQNASDVSANPRARPTLDHHLSRNDMRDAAFRPQPFNADRMPPLLAATERLQQARPPAASAPGSRRVSTPAAGEPTEVHVHIGRIEVTALQQPSAPRKTPRSGRTPMSLDDYLARRKGSVQ